MVYRGGLENRFGLTPDGGSVPPSPPDANMNDYIVLGIEVVVVGVLFWIAWSKGYIQRLSLYMQETREELRKCSWPTPEELKGSTAVVMASIVLLGGFIVLADFLLVMLIKAMMPA